MAFLYDHIALAVSASCSTCHMRPTGGVYIDNGSLPWVYTGCSSPALAGARALSVDVSRHNSHEHGMQEVAAWASAL